jgi:hypothetical protein
MFESRDFFLLESVPKYAYSDIKFVSYNSQFLSEILGQN